MTLPNFLFIGPDKTGSTWLYRILDCHPQCYVPACKDIYFFDRYYARGLGWYEGFFKDAPADALAVGELSHDYLFSAETAKRIARDLPGVRLLTSLRDPVERTFSHYMQLLRSGLETGTFEDALRRHPFIIDNSKYGKHLAPYLDLFDRTQLQVLFFQDLKRSPEDYARTVFDYLGPPFVADLPYRERVMEAAVARSPVLARTAKFLANSARDLGLAELVGKVKYSPLGRSFYKNLTEDAKPKLSPETEMRLREEFLSDVEALERLLGMSLAHWKPGAADNGKVAAQGGRRI